MKRFFKFKKRVIIAILLFIAVLSGAGLAYFNFRKNNEAKIVHAGTGDNVSGFAWSENFGWVSFNSTDCDTDDNGYIDTDVMVQGCGGDNSTTITYNYGVSINEATGNFFGYAWSEYAGWVSFNRKTCDGGADNGKGCVQDSDCAGGASCALTGQGATGVPPVAPYNASENFIANYNSGTGAVTGWAKILVLGDDGWIKLRKDASDSGADYGVSIDLVTGDFSGWAWNGNATAGVGIGWVSFSGAAPDYKVHADINIAPALPTIGAISSLLCSGSLLPVQVSWTDNSNNEIGFIVERDDGSGWLQHCSLSYPKTDSRSAETGVLRECSGYANEGTSHSFRVKATGELGNDSGWSPGDSGQPYTTGYCPPILSVNSYNCDSIILNWSYNGTDNYKVFRKKDAEASWSEIATGLTAKNYTDTNNILSNSTYQYYVRAETEELDSSALGPINPCPKLPKWKEVKP